MSAGSGVGIDGCDVKQAKQDFHWSQEDVSAVSLKLKSLVREIRMRGFGGKGRRWRPPLPDEST